MNLSHQYGVQMQLMEFMMIGSKNQEDYLQWEKDHFTLSYKNMINSNSSTDHHNLVQTDSHNQSLANEVPHNEIHQTYRSECFWYII